MRFKKRFYSERVNKSNAIATKHILFLTIFIFCNYYKHHMSKLTVNNKDNYPRHTKMQCIAFCPFPSSKKFVLTLHWHSFRTITLHVFVFQTTSIIEMKLSPKIRSVINIP